MQHQLLPSWASIPLSLTLPLLFSSSLFSPSSSLHPDGSSTSSRPFSSLFCSILSSDLPSFAIFCALLYGSSTLHGQTNCRGQQGESSKLLLRSLSPFPVWEWAAGWQRVIAFEACMEGETFETLATARHVSRARTFSCWESPTGLGHSFCFLPPLPPDGCTVAALDGRIVTTPDRFACHRMRSLNAPPDQGPKQATGSRDVGATVYGATAATGYADCRMRWNFCQLISLFIS